MKVRVVRHAGAGAFLERAGDWLLEREAENNLILGIAAALESGEEAYGDPVYLATVEDGREVVGCAWRTPPFRAGLTRMPAGAAAPVAADMAEVYDALPAVLGEESAARAFGAAWASLRGVEARPGMRQRIHELTEVRLPRRPPAGAPRVALTADLELALRWWRAFQDDAGVPVGPDPEATVARRIEAGDIWLWDDGGPVSLAGAAARTPRGVRVGPVYTPPEHRRKGYATALVADLSRRLLDGGRDLCFLYTDLANPTSNSIYAAVGYRPVCDVRDYDFVEAGGASGEGSADGRVGAPGPDRDERPRETEGG